MVMARLDESQASGRLEVLAGAQLFLVLLMELTPKYNVGSWIGQPSCFSIQIGSPLVYSVRLSLYC